MKPSAKWLKKYEQVKHLLTPISDLTSYFKDSEIAGMKVATFSMGKVNFPTGEILVRDPLVTVSKDSEPYLQKVPAGIYDLQICAVLDEGYPDRYAAAMVAFSEQEPVKYYEALVGYENLDTVTEEGTFFGFGVDAGLATIMDMKTRDAYVAFVDKTTGGKGESMDFNMYDDFFKEIFAKSYQDYPEHQRDGGDWINWTIPDTNLSVPMFQSGFGDGDYPVYFGYDAKNEVCRVVVHFIDIATAYSEEEDGGD
ncbi:MAG: DUF4241 domain-containing protein [Deferribacteraceae bacterium]|jgi:hypothetical protein|nr:DUF4241 domain-containing protein [Deferribacteraceae bacterium]